MKLFREAVAPKDQLFLLPMCVDEFVEPDSPARIITEIIDCMDLDMLYQKYKGGGAPAYDPATMLKIIIFGYCHGIRSSRKIDTALGHDLRFMYISQMSHPDFRTIAIFRRSNLDVIEHVFKETVRISMAMGMVLLLHASVDGTKIEANVSSKATYKKDRLNEALEKADKKIAEILKEAEDEDQKEDALYGDKRGDEASEELKDAKKRKKRLEEAKKKLEEIGRNSIGTTDTDSRLMKTKSGNRPAYNGQAVVDKEHQVIVAADVTQDESDNAQLQPMIESAKENTGAVPGVITADGGYYSPGSLEYVEKEGLDAYIPDSLQESRREGFEYNKDKDEYTCPAGKSLVFYTERKYANKKYRLYRCYKCSGCAIMENCHGKSSRYKELWQRQNDELQQAMALKIRSDEGRDIYNLRKEIVEPVFGNIKDNIGLRRLLLRGLEGAKIEFLLACASHNIGKIRRFMQANRGIMIPV